MQAAYRNPALSAQQLSNRPVANTPMSNDNSLPCIDIDQANKKLSSAKPEDIIRYALERAERPIISSSFGPHSAALLHMVIQQRPDIIVLWADSGYNTAATYRFSDKVSELLKLNLKTYVPTVSAAHLNARYRGIPDADTDEHTELTRIVKLEPFAAGFAELKPDLWINGMRKEETEFRQSQSIFTFDQNRKVTKVAPMFHWSESEVETYLHTHQLPMEQDYFDPTKVEASRECGLHTYVI